MSTEDIWIDKLSPEQYAVLRNKETEAPYSGALLHNEEDGVYTCAGCGTVLFFSEQKFDSECGWPSFFNVAKAESVKLTQDKSAGMDRVEISCAKCSGHLGHVFNDAPDQPTGLRFCVNSVSLDFKPE